MSIFLAVSNCIRSNSEMLGIYVSLIVGLAAIIYGQVEKKTANEVFSASFPGCWQSNRLKGRAGHISASNSSAVEGRRIVAIGDVHGEVNGLREILFQAKITSSPKSCKWRPETSSNPVLLVQNGDIVDRGANATEAWQCLQQLQSKASTVGSQVVRLVGNHELLWLEGMIRYRNKESDTPKKVLALVKKMKKDINSGALQGAFNLDHVSGISMLFIHAGIRPQMLDKFGQYLKKEEEEQQIEKLMKSLAKAKEKENEIEELNELDSQDQKSQEEIAVPIKIEEKVVKIEEKVVPSAAFIAKYMNDNLQKDLKKCVGAQEMCSLKTDLYGAGPERGGGSVGGPYWTDFRVLEIASSQSGETSYAPFVQIVGHTVKRGQIRHTRGLQAICIDHGMFIGGRAYLEITKEGRFTAHEKQNIDGPKNKQKWACRDLSSVACTV